MLGKKNVGLVLSLYGSVVHAGGFWGGLFAEQQQVPGAMRNQTAVAGSIIFASTPTPTPTTMLSTVTVVTTSVSLVTPTSSSVIPFFGSPTPTPSFGFPSITSLSLIGPTLACSYDPLIPNLFNSTVSNGNISAIFNLTNTTNPDFCGARHFCRNRPPGLYCYSTVDRCKRNNETEPCLPVAMVACPQALFVGCAEGFACQDEGGPWWDEEAFYSPIRLPFSSTLQDQFNQSQSFNQTQSPQFNESQPFSQRPHLASCRAIIEPTQQSSPTISPAVYQLKDQVDICASSSSVTSTICVTPTAKSFITSSSSTCPPTISTIWWWPTMTDTVSQSISSPTDTSKGQAPCPEVKKYLSPPKICNGPYPAVPTSTLTLLYMSSYAVVSTSISSVQTTSVTTQTVSQIVTQTSTIMAEPPIPSTVTVSAPASVITVTQAAPVPSPAPTVAPIPPPAVSTEGVVTAKTSSTPPAPSQAAPVATAIGAKIPSESFPKAGEPYQVYSAKAAAIATIIQV